MGSVCPEIICVALIKVANSEFRYIFGTWKLRMDGFLYPSGIPTFLFVLTLNMTDWKENIAKRGKWSRLWQLEKKKKQGWLLGGEGVEKLKEKKNTHTKDYHSQYFWKIHNLETNSCFSHSYLKLLLNLNDNSLV